MIPVLILIALIITWWWTRASRAPEGSDTADGNLLLIPKHVDEALTTLHPFAPEHIDRARRHYARFMALQYDDAVPEQTDRKSEIIRMAVMVNAREATFRVPNDQHSRRAVDGAIQIIKEAFETTSS
jgi:hypothetical protein